MTVVVVSERNCGSELFGVRAGDQFGPDVLRSGLRPDGFGRGGLGESGRRIGFGGNLLRVGDRDVGQRGVAGCGGDGDDEHGGALRGLAECRRGSRRGAATQARAVVSTFEAARAATIHPFEVAANRNAFVQLVRSNWFGLNAPAIAAAECLYEQMWAQDVTAMVGYHTGVSAVAAQLSSWQQLPVAAAQAIAAETGLNLNIGGGNRGNLNLGAGNRGDANLGMGNTGNNNPGSGNHGDANLGSGNTGNNNVGSGNSGSTNLGMGNTGNQNLGSGNTGSGNAGSGNIGSGNVGSGNIGDSNLGSGNTVAETSATAISAAAMSVVETPASVGRRAATTSASGTPAASTSASGTPATTTSESGSPATIRWVSAA